MVLSVTQCRMLYVTRSEGGVSHDSAQRCHNSILPYLSHPAVIIPCESAPSWRAGGKEGRTRATPPQSGGACDPE